MTLKHTPLDEIGKIHARLRATFDSGKTLPLSYRRQQLLQLARLVQQNAHAFEDALWREFRKQPLEIAMVDLSPVVSAALYAAENLERWAGVEEVRQDELAHREDSGKHWHTTIHKQPKGLVVNISPWNYPIILSLSPLVGAIAAGCTAILKPSEHTPLVSALFAELFPKYLDPDAYAVVNGAVEETGCLLGLKFDHIFFTGSTHVGRIVAKAAAKQLATVTLELGGKSPVFVDAAHTDLDIAARRILWGRQVCAGQVCVSPDYVLVPRAHQDAFVDAVKRAYEEFWPSRRNEEFWPSRRRDGTTLNGHATQNGTTASEGMATASGDGMATATEDRKARATATEDGMATATGDGKAIASGDGKTATYSTLSGVHPTARTRINALVRDTRGEVVVGAAKLDGNGKATSGDGEWANNAILALTIVRDVGLGDALMKGEIFGPILPIVPVDDASPSANADDSCVDAAIRIINSNPAPLVIYIFTEREGVRERFLRSTRSGTLVLNDCVQQLAVYEMPFGGVGESGSGAWFGKATFETFTDRRRVRARGREEGCQ